MVSVLIIKLQQYECSEFKVVLRIQNLLYNVILFLYIFFPCCKLLILWKKPHDYIIINTKTFSENMAGEKKKDGENRIIHLFPIINIKVKSEEEG